jgi:hypothetical protein
VKVNEFWSSPLAFFGAVIVPVGDFFREMTPKGKERNKISMVEVKKWFDDKGMAQIYSTGTEYAFFSKDGEQCHPFAYCKDFLQDAVWATLNNSTASIYGFVYEHGKNPALDMDNVRIALRLKKTSDFSAMCKKALTFMQELDADMGFDPTEMHALGKYAGNDNKGNPVEPADEVFLFVGDKRWLHSSPLLSLYTLCLRVGLNYEGGGWRQHFEGAEKYIGSNDKSYTRSAMKSLDKIVGKDVAEIFAEKIEDNYPKDLKNNMHGLHNAGIVNYTKEHIPAAMKEKWENNG